MFNIWVPSQTSLVVPGLRLHTSAAGGKGTKIPHVTQPATRNMVVWKRNYSGLWRVIKHGKWGPSQRCCREGPYSQLEQEEQPWVHTQQAQGLTSGTRAKIQGGWWMIVARLPFTSPHWHSPPGADSRWPSCVTGQWQLGPHALNVCGSGWGKDCGTGGSQGLECLGKVLFSYF